ncbi:MAG: hypothetical protein CL868_05605 [Cytophagaceae bacterium]|nr:hypothetical protein [Cytophagaceae bacterium]
MGTFSFAQTVELDGQRGYGNRQVWDDNNYANCEAWQRAVDNGTYKPPSGFKDIKCEDKAAAGGGITLSGRGAALVQHRAMARNNRDATMRQNTVEVNISGNIHARQLVLCGDNNKCYQETRYNSCEQLQRDVEKGVYKYPDGWKNVTCTVNSQGVLLSNGMENIKSAIYTGNDRAKAAIKSRN